MFQHGGLNRVYRLVWSDSTGAYIPIAENSLKVGGRRSHGVIGCASALVLAVASGLTPFACADPTRAVGIAPQNTTVGLAPGTLPTAGEVVVGQATISQTANHQTINQTSNKAAINWQTFNIAADSKVTFVQPDANSIALNRVVTHEASQIYGKLDANGQVFLINPNGVLFGKGAQVNVGGIIASTRDISNESFSAGDYKFSGKSASNIVNEGKITAADNGYIAFIGAQVINRGDIQAHQGDVRLAAADEVEIQLDNSRLVHLSTTQGTLDALAANGGVIKADGGRIFLTADALDQLSKASVNNTGIIEAQTIGTKNGKIVLLGDEQVGSTHVAGTLDASAPDGGNGGFIETSAAHVKVDSNARITTAGDVTGTWLIDPVDFTIAATGGDITGADLTTALVSTNVTVQSTSGAAGTEGDVNVNDTVTWSSNTLTLNAQADINFNASITATGTGALALEFGQATNDGADSNYHFAPSVEINLPNGQNFSTKKGSAGSVDIYTVISSVGLEGSDNDGTLQGIKGNLDGLYVLGADVDANATANWNVVNGVPWGFDAIGSGFQDPQTQEWQIFTGNFEGLGHTIDGLSINRDVRSNQGLFGVVHGVTIQNVALTNVSIVGNDNIGALVGNAANVDGPSIFRNVHVTGTINGSSRIGGLIGRLEEGIIERASSSATVNAGLWVGGIAGELTNVTLSNLDASGQVSGEGIVGGAIGRVVIGTVTNVTTSGTVTSADSYAGGAFGIGNGTFENIHSTASVTSSGGYAGGLVGEASGDTMTNVSASGMVSGTYSVGGLIGRSTLAITDASATGAVTGTRDDVGGLVGDNGGTLTGVEASGAVSGRDNVGGLVGGNYGNITDGQATGNIIGSGKSVGGLVGLTQETVITNSHAYGTVTGANKLGGLAGANKMGQIIGSTANGLTSGNADQVGGLVGYNKMGFVDNSTYTAASVVGNNMVGGLVGNNEDGTVQNSNVATDVTGTGDRVGGLIGFSRGTVATTYATGKVTGVSRVGGLIGESRSTISDSHATGSVNANGDYVGGLAGSSEGNISNSYATGVVSGAIHHAGGLAGFSDGAINTVYATGNVTATGDNIGGLFGEARGSINSASASGNVVGNERIGGLIGLNYASVDTADTSGTVNGKLAVGGVAGANNGVLERVQSSGSVTGVESFIGGIAGINEGGALIRKGGSTGNVSGTFSIGGVAGENYGDIEQGTASGAVAGNVEVIGGLVGFHVGTLVGGNFTGATVSGGEAVGGAVGVNYGVIDGVTVATAVSGTLDIGGLVGYSGGEVMNSTVSGTVTGTAENVGGAIGTLEGGPVTNVITSAIVSGVEYVGGLFGIGGGEISNSHATGAVSGNAYVGGFAGENSGSIETSTATGSVTATDDNVGGFVGYTTGTINDSQADGNVTGANYVGGFAGYVEEGSVSGSIANGNVTGESRIGGFAGYNSDKIENSFAHGDVTGEYRVGGFAGRVSSSGEVSESLADGDVFGTDSQIGGFAGANDGTLNDVEALGDVSAATASDVGGLIGLHRGSVAFSEAGGGVTGNENVGGFIGKVDFDTDDDDVPIPASIIGGTASGAVNGAKAVGGLIGLNDLGEVGGSQASGTVTATSNRAGGLIGYNSGLVEESSASGAVTGVAEVGGLIGFADSASLVFSTDATGTVTASADYVGGLIGVNKGSVNSSSTDNAVSGVNIVGALVGSNEGKISSGSTTGTVAGQNNVGGFVGDNSGSITKATANAGVTATGDAVGGFVAANTGTIKDSHATGNVSGRHRVGGFVGWLSGTGQVSNATATGLVNGTDFIGGFAGYNDANTAILESHAEGDVTGTSQVGGFFGYNAGLITDAWTNSLVSGSEDVGGFGGYQHTSGSVEKIYSVGDVTVTGNVSTASAGGLIGENAGAIKVAYTTGSVAGATVGSDVGGLVGTQSGTITDAYATGAVSGSSNVGAVIGHNQSGTVKNVYGKGAVSANGAAVGGVVGLLAGGGIANAYWNIASTGLSQGAGSTTGGTLNGVGFNANQSLQSSNYTGFDFAPETGAWKNYDGDTTPLLTAWLTELTVTVSDAPITYVYNGTGRTDAVSGLTYSDSSAPSSGLLFGSAHYNTSKNVGSYTDLFGLYSHQQGYNITFVNNGYLQITPKAIEVAAAGNNKVYDGLAGVSVNLTPTGVINGDVITFTGVGSTADKNVATGKSVNVMGIAAQGADAGNYSFNTTAQTTADITKKSIVVDASAVNRAYNGGKSVDVNLNSSGVVSGDSVAFTGAGIMADKNAGTGKAVAVNDIAGSGADLDNYEFNTLAETTVDISKKLLESGAMGVNRTYDGTTTVAVTYSPVGVLDGDDLTLSGGIGTMVNKNVGEGKSVAVTDIVASGAELANYEVNTTAQTTVDIAKRTLLVNGQGVNRVYDGTTAVGVILAPVDLVEGDSVQLSGTGNTLDKNAGQGKEVSVSSIAGIGNDAGNYIYVANGPTTVNIAKLGITVAAKGVNRTYDGTTQVGVTLTSGNIINGDNLVFSGTGVLATKDAGNAKPVTVSAITGTGADLGNYEFNSSAQTSVDIAKREIAVSATGLDKTFDGTTAVAVNVSTSGLLSGDQLTLSGTGATANQNAGQAKAVSVTGITAGGVDAGNYTFSSTAQTTANVTPKPIQVTLKAPVVKIADGNTNAQLTAGNFVLNGLIPGDSISVTKAQGQFSNALPGTGKTISVALTNSDYSSQGGTVLSNYALANATLTGDFGQILATTTPAYEAVIATIPTNPSTVPTASNFSVIVGSHGPAVSTGDSDNGVSTESGGPKADGGIASIQTRETLVFRRTFSIADGGIRLPSGVTDDNSAQ